MTSIAISLLSTASSAALDSGADWFCNDRLRSRIRRLRSLAEIIMLFIVHRSRENQHRASQGQVKGAISPALLTMDKGELEGSWAVKEGCEL